MKTRPWVAMNEGLVWTRYLNHHTLTIAKSKTGLYAYSVADGWNYQISEGLTETLSEAVQACVLAVKGEE